MYLSEQIFLRNISGLIECDLHESKSSAPKCIGNFRDFFRWCTADNGNELLLAQKVQRSCVIIFPFKVKSVNCYGAARENAQCLLTIWVQRCGSAIGWE